MLASVTGGKNQRNPDYARLGYATDGGGLSKTLEYAWFDAAAARMAAACGKTEEARSLFASSGNFKNLYNEEVMGMRARNPDGSWLPWQGRTTQGQNCVESNPYQQGWFVPHDTNGLINLLGGQDRALGLLEPFFDKVPEDFLWNDYYNHANEPVHHVPYLFPYMGKPWLTQKWVRKIMNNAYGPDVMGLVGNEDVGQMSAWFILSAMGFHPVDTTAAYVIGSPLFNRMTLRLDPAYYPGRTFTITAANNSPENVHVQSAKLNGVPLNRAWIAHSEIVKGGELEFVMGPRPNTSWGLDPDGRLPSISPRYVCTEAKVETAGDGTCIAKARIKGVGGEMKSSFPVSVYAGEKNLGSIPVTLGPGEERVFGIPFALPAEKPAPEVIRILDRQVKMENP